MQAGESLVVCDATDSVSIVRFGHCFFLPSLARLRNSRTFLQTGYNAVQVSPRLQIIPFEPVSREFNLRRLREFRSGVPDKQTSVSLAGLDAGVGSILRSFEGFLENRLRKTKFKSSLPSSIPRLLEEFQSRILPVLAGAHEQNQSAEIQVKIIPEGQEKEVKGATSSDKGAKIEKGWMTISS